MESLSTPNLLTIIPLDILDYTVRNFLAFKDQVLFSGVSRQTNVLTHRIREFINKKICCLFAARVKQNKPEILKTCQHHFEVLTAFEIPNLKLSQVTARELLDIIKKNPQIDTLKFQLEPQAKVSSLFRQVGEVIQQRPTLRIASLPTLAKRDTQILESLQGHTKLEELAFEKIRRIDSTRDQDEQSLLLLANIINNNPRLKTLQMDGTFRGTEKSFLAVHNALKSAPRLSSLNLSTLSRENSIPILFMNAVAEMPFLQELNLDNCKLPGKILEQIWSSHPSLRSLSLHSCSVLSPVVTTEELYLSKKITHLNLGGSCSLGENFSSSLIETLADPNCSLQSLEVANRFVPHNLTKASLFNALASNQSLKTLIYAGTFSQPGVVEAFRSFMGTNGSLQSFIHKGSLFSSIFYCLGEILKENHSLKYVTLARGDITVDTLVKLIQTNTSLECLSVRIQLLIPVDSTSAKDKLTKILTALPSNKTLRQLRLVQASSFYCEDHLNLLQKLIEDHGESERVSITFKS